MHHESSDSNAAAEPPPLRSVHTSDFPSLMRRLGVSLFITTYQAGKLVIVRADGDRLNTHFRTFQAPMGLALAAIAWPWAQWRRKGALNGSSDGRI